MDFVDINRSELFNKYFKMAIFIHDFYIKLNLQHAITIKRKDN